MTDSNPQPTKPTRGKPKTLPVIEIKVSWCKGCGLCVDYCNLGVIEMNGAVPKVVKLEKCTRCMQCEVICPDFAIRVTDPPQEDESDKSGEDPR